jgi:D-alanyl-D-alanine carboxypeptidase
VPVDVQARLAELLELGIPGAAVVAVGPTGSVAEAAGLADVAGVAPLTVDHRFRIGSVTKVFVAALALRLVADGLLELDQESAPFVEGVTVRQLLNHTAGLDDFIGDFVAFFEPYRADIHHRWKLDAREELQLVMDKARVFPPGEGWAYRGANYIALRLVIEEALGVGLREALRQRVLSPLGLTRTDLVEEPLRGDCARGYIPADNPILPADAGLVDVTELDAPFYRAGGGIVSTPGEVAAMLRALLGEGFIPDAIRDEMLDAVDSAWDETDRYGLGMGEISTLMRRSASPCGPAWGHLGFSLGYIAIALSSEDGKRQVVICANGQPANASDLDACWEAAGRLAWSLYCG